MERMMDGMNGGMETSAPMPDMGTPDNGGAAAAPARPRRSSRPKAAKKSASKTKSKARKTGSKRPKAKARGKTRKSGGTKRAKKGGRRR